MIPRQRPDESSGPRPATLGEAVNGVRWDFDPSHRLLSPLVGAARYFEQFPWDGEDEPGTPAAPANPSSRSA